MRRFGFLINGDYGFPAMTQNIQIYPPKVAIQDVADQEHLDERISAINCLFANLVGVGEDYLEFCSEKEGSDRDELLAWSWFIKPSQGEAITKASSVELCALITHYQNGTMNYW